MQVKHILLIFVTNLTVLFSSSVMSDLLFSEQQLDQFHDSLTTRVATTARWLDMFFDDVIYEDEQNQSHLKLRFDTFSEKGSSLDFQPHVKGRLRLPGAEKKWNLFISGNDDFDQNNATNNLTNRTEETESSIGLNYFINRDLQKSISISGGVSRRDGEYGVYLKPRLRKLWQFQNWDIRFTQAVRFHTNSKVDSSSRLDFENILTNKLFFRFTSQLDWYETKAGLFYSNNFIIRQSINKDQVLTYEWSNYFKTKPENILEQVDLRIVYRRRFWKKWLFYEFSPQITFSEENDYHPNPGLLLRLEMVFGYGNISL
jgi:hypothetical protein